MLSLVGALPSQIICSSVPTGSAASQKDVKTEMEALSLPGLSRFTRFMQWPPVCAVSALHPRTD